MSFNTILFADSEHTIDSDWYVKSDEVLIFKNCTLRFAKDTGIFSSGKIEAENCTFIPINPKEGWKGIADIGKGRSTFIGCNFIGGRGRPIGELKEYFISRYFGEIDDIEIVETWSDFNEDEQAELYNMTYGGVLIALNTLIERCYFDDCRVHGKGGAIVGTFNVQIDNCNFIRCRAGIDGGAIIMQGHGSVRKSLFESCRSRDEGGAIMSMNSSARIERCHFKRCISRNGGGVSAQEKINIQECSFVECIAIEGGGGLSGNVNAYRLIFRKCIARQGGGVKFIENGRLSASRFHRCVAKKNGGGLQAFPMFYSIVNLCRFFQCTATETGGGAQIGATRINCCDFLYNRIMQTKANYNLSIHHLDSNDDSLIEECEFT